MAVTKKTKGKAKATKTGAEIIREIDAKFPDLSAPEVVGKAKQMGHDIAISNVYSVRHADGKKAEKKKAKPVAKRRVTKTPKSAKAREITPEPSGNGNGHAVDSDLLGLKLELAAEKAKREVLEQALGLG